MSNQNKAPKVSIEGPGYIFESYVMPSLAERIMTLILEDQRERRLRRGDTPCTAKDADAN